MQQRNIFSAMDWSKFGVTHNGGRYSVKADNVAWLILLVFGKTKRLVRVNHVPTQDEVEEIFKKYGNQNHCKFWTYFQNNKDSGKVLSFEQYPFDMMIEAMLDELKKLCRREVK